jgi:hypothetical protein
MDVRADSAIQAFLGGTPQYGEKSAVQISKEFFFLFVVTHF